MEQAELFIGKIEIARGRLFTNLMQQDRSWERRAQAIKEDLMYHTMDHLEADSIQGVWDALKAEHYDLSCWEVGESAYNEGRFSPWSNGFGRHRKIYPRYETREAQERYERVLLVVTSLDDETVLMLNNKIVTPPPAMDREIKSPRVDPITRLSRAFFQGDR